MSQDWPPPEEFFIDEKPGIRYYLIIAALSQLPPDLDKGAYHQEALKIREKLDADVKLAVAYEREGKSDFALPVLKKLVNEAYDGIYPYQKLQEYYNARGDRAGVNEVLNQFSNVVMTIKERGTNRPDLIALLDNIK